ncbi:MAG: pimelyl-ACP methyl ester esterase BioV [Sulfuricurvum sp.]|uniref:pimelyl-ACP methyl ester esterase BioV n=1 Tax=Sulfuricurvum sp. TaxID=2025608 RepID=UPI002606153C|nr:pimelyl-ACP methyl ester esterase BioV [Sulfuricurvum sp.]MDD2830499.1 pimelyl-ACP methyl ester esterase BioV [Sulfuricurvum sp.]MDD4949484.1 pimelyl-ACP methyl ester esterase BioV [Sulfuricurvum sp.]
MIFYSGFSLKNETHYFDNFLEKSLYSVAGFSYGSIKAAHYALEATHRIDTLQLFSPAFFQTQTEAFKKLQLKGFVRSPQGYRESFLINCFSPYPVHDVELNHEDNEENLRELLYFEWTNELMEAIRSKGVRIEVYLGLEDRVIDVASTREFFLPYATVTSIRRGNHFLQEGL